ncbi:hypothetical protein [Rhizobium sp. BE258]|uniref:hypothetical protein n=1 Tax=Rhizobium sp. BE258 TaxID=2817722 RepID=UPI0028671014|nr:hypothetical protein [Rhizobium sp. BE258]MDR7145187.1 hypothetical protein [Rhizobium sp. BE258]
MVKEAIDADHEIDNPVTFSRGKVQFDQTATDNEKIMQDQMATLSARLAVIEDLASTPKVRPHNFKNRFSEDVVRALMVPPSKTIELTLSINALTEQQAMSQAERLLSSSFERYTTVSLAEGAIVYSVEFNQLNMMRMRDIGDTLKGMGFEIAVRTRTGRQ